MENSVDKCDGSDTRSSSNQVKQTFELLNDGENHIKLCDQSEAVVLVGTTGTGKSTLAQFVTGKELRSIEVEETVGEFTITDGDDRISITNTLTSKTFYPELIIDDETNVAYYDCPGFEDTRGTAHDISETYFIKKVMDSIEFVKICFVVCYHSCRTATDRHSFKTLTKHAVKFLKDIDKYRDAICLIVTKVDNRYEKQGKSLELIPDGQIIKNIAKFLKEVIEALKDDMSKNLTDKDRKLYEDGIKLVNIMLEQRENDYHRIAIFRRPDEPGLLSEIEMLDDNKKRLTRLLHETLKFVKKDNNDFSYSISDKSQSDVFGMIDHINDKFTEFASCVANSLKNEVQSRLPLYDNIYELKNYLKKKKNELNDLISSITTKTTTQEFVDKISSLKEMFNLELNENIVTDANNQVHYFRFFQDVSDKELTKRPVEWSNPLKKAQDYIAELNAWYNFLISLYKELSKYESQRNKNQIAKNFTIEEGKFDIFVGNFSDFLNKLPKDIGINFSECAGIDVNEYQIKEFKHVIDKTVLTKQIFEKNDKQLIVHGEYVNLSEISEDGLKDVTTVIIFATNTVFIDKDFKQPSMSLAIISPHWEIISERVIDLSGEDGKDFSPPCAASRQDWERDVDGHNGLPGLPGGSGGNFLGIGTEFKNGFDLNIFCNGGCGGRGQDGGKGAVGSKGENVNMDKMNDVDQSALTFEVECRQLGYTYDRYSSSKDTFLNFVDYWSYKAYGTLGHHGGNGGDGGRGGLGGNAGTIRLFELGEESHAKLTNYKGKDGNGGIGGEGGLGGVRGDGIDIQYTNNYKYKIKSTGLIAPDSEGRGPQGNHGTSNLFSDEQEVPQVVKSIKIPNVINKYKRFAREEKPDIFKQITTSQFICDIESKINIENECDIHSYIEEFYDLEMQLHEIQHVQLSTVYSSLKKRIVEFAKKYNNDMEIKKTLNYLYVAANSKLYYVETKLRTSFIVDINSFLDSTVEKIQRLEKLDTFDTCEKIRKEYEDQLKKKINEANKFIENDVISEINNVGLSINKEIEKLLEETIDMQKKSDDENKKLIEVKTRLKNQLKLQRLFGTIKLLATIAGFFGPIAQAIGAVFIMGTEIAEPLVLNQDAVQAVQVKIPNKVTENIEKALGTFITQRQKKIVLLNEQIDKILSKSAAVDEETREKLVQIKTSLINMDKNSLNQTEIEDKKNKVELALKKNCELKKQKNSSHLNKAKCLLDNFQMAVEVADVSIDIYNSINQDKNKMKQITNEIKRSENEFNSFKKYEEKILDTMVPILDEMKDFVNDMLKDSESKSQVALRVTKWKVRSRINDIKLQMHLFTKGFQVEESLLRCIEKLKEAMTTLVSLFDQIQEYYQQRELAEYLANICSPTSIAIKIKDENLLNDIKKLELKIQSNILLAQFNKAKQAFSQWVFPFAKVYLPKFELPLDLQFNNGIESLISNAVKHVEEMRSNVKEYKQCIVKGMDEYLTIKEFNSEGISTKPFYIWEKAKFKDAILDLLSGNKVKFYSDVRQCEDNENEAVKFKSIGIRLKYKDESTDDKLEEHLKNFQVEMVHHGQSYYKVKNEVYVINGDSQTIVYTFEKGADGTPATTNMVYEKIMSGDIVLSPYTLWSIQLVDLTKSGFDDLKKYADRVNLELFGEGTCVIGNPDLGLDLSKYYQKA